MALEFTDPGSDVGAEPSIPVAPAPSSPGAINARDAMRSVMDWRRKSAAGERNEQQADVSAAETPAAPATESTATAAEDAAAAPQPPGETESADREPDAPPI